jgi:hypothetical protein
MWMLNLLKDLVTKLVMSVDLTGVMSLARLVFKHWKTSLIVLLCGLLFGLGYGWSHDHNQLLKEQATHKQDVANFKRAQAEADALAKTQANSLKREAQHNANEADAKYASLLAQYRASLVRYQANQGGTKQADSNQLPATESGNGPGGSSFISITLGDAQICAVNTARLQAVHDWAANLPTDGDVQ